jgi:hypothetical protein
MHSDSCDAAAPDGQIEVMLDGQPVGLPPQRRSLTAIRSYLEGIALERQRVLWSFGVVGEAASPAGLPAATGQFVRVTGRTIGLEQMPLQMVENAIQQTAHAHEEVQAAVSCVMINEASRARELWWNLTRGLKQPLLTLSLLPDTVCAIASGSASLLQLRRWQLQQLACVIRDVDKACLTDDPTTLSNALEQRVLPWLEGLQESLDLLRHTLLTAPAEAGRGCPQCAV